MSSKPALLADVVALDDARPDRGEGAAGDVALLAEIVPASCVDGPGNRFAVFFQGCDFDCLACHNPHTIPQRKVGTSYLATLDDVIGQLREAEPFVSGVTVSGGEATLQWQFVRRLFATIKSDPRLAHLTTLVDSNGNATLDVWDALAPVMDGAMIDLKAFDPDLHLELTRRPNHRVLESIRHLAGLGKLHEVRLLLIPGVNDTDDELVPIARWLVGIDPSVRVRLNGFRRIGTRLLACGFDDATPAHLAAAAETLARHGLDPSAITCWSPTEATPTDEPPRIAV